MSLDDNICSNSLENRAKRRTKAHLSLIGISADAFSFPQLCSNPKKKPKKRERERDIMVSSNKKIIAKNKEQLKKSKPQKENKKPQTAQEFKEQLRKIEEELASFGVSSNDETINEVGEVMQVVKPGQRPKKPIGEEYHSGLRGGGVRKSSRKASSKMNRRKLAKIKKAMDYIDKNNESIVKKWQKKVAQISQ